MNVVNNEKRDSVANPLLLRVDLFIRRATIGAEMTAEVAVMNRMGVALAADSAVTIGGGGNKIYTSAEKLFQLSEVAPVGIMVYGNAGFVSLPWETIIKAFRRQLAKNSLPTIEEYCKEFVLFLRTHPELFPDENRLHVMQRLLYSLFASIKNRRADAVTNKRKAKQKSGGGALTPEELGEIFAEVIDETLKEVKSEPEIEGLDDASRKKVRKTLAPSVPEIIEEAFDGISRPDGVDDKLFDLGLECLGRQSFSNYTSGIVIAGFGDKEYMPALASFEVEECIDVIPRMTPIKEFQISGTGRRAFMMPFAQRDSVIQFLFGVDSEISTFMAKSVSQMTNGLVDVILEKIAEVDAGLSGALGDPIKVLVEEKLKDLYEAWDSQQGEYFSPVLDTISMLPKDELAAMAEAFVNLTKFRRRVTPVAETVSGPIDVAVITKGDGFIWIRRKHYFAPEINPRIMARFQRPGENQ